MIRHRLICAALGLIVWLNRDSRYLEHHAREVGYWFKEDGPDKWMAEGSRDLLAVFASQGHSGSSAPFMVALFTKLAGFEPWGPLTGEESEWGKPFDDRGTQQNIRCSHVFRSPSAGAYDVNGRVFRDSSGTCWTNRSSHVPVTFPYTPTVEYVDVDESEL